MNTDGAWQDVVEGVLRHHFETIPIKYDDYRRLGFLRVVAAPLLIGAAFVIAIFPVFGLVSPGWAWASGVAAAGALVLAARRRSNVTAWFSAEMDTRLKGKITHVIAHSFGTYLIGRVIAKFPKHRLDRVVLTGAVLPYTFPWDRVLERNPYALRAVRNEVGRKDMVVWSIYLARLLVPGLLPTNIGYSGVTGFRQRYGLVHTSRRPYGPCEACIPHGPRPPIHNVHIAEFTHSDAFIDAEHARTFWLPFLWDIPPGEHQEFSEICELAEGVEDEGDWLALLDAEGELRETAWAWAGGRSLESYVRRRLRNRFPHAGPEKEELIDAIFSTTWTAVQDAKRELEKPEAQQRPEVVRALDPRLALFRAIGRAVE